MASRKSDAQNKRQSGRPIKFRLAGARARIDDRDKDWGCRVNDTQKLLSALCETTGRQPQQIPNGMMACCPPHEDKTPSLSVETTTDNRQLSLDPVLAHAERTADDRLAYLLTPRSERCCRISATEIREGRAGITFRSQGRLFFSPYQKLVLWRLPAGLVYLLDGGGRNG